MIDYDKIVNNALLEVVRVVLIKLKKLKLLRDNHFYITFLVNYPGVLISKKLKQKYSKQMTIVLQHQFKDLEISKDYFSVILTFDGTDERIKVPFKSLVSFYDPHAEFNLSFNNEDEDEDYSLYNLSDNDIDFQMDNMPDNVISIDLAKRKK